MRQFFLFILAALFVVAGLVHLFSPAIYLPIVPKCIPFPYFVVIFSGFCELIFGILLLPYFSRSTAAWLIIAFLIAVFPANIQMAINTLHQNDRLLMLTILRLPVQPLLIWWAYSYTRKKISRKW